MYRLFYVISLSIIISLFCSLNVFAQQQADRFVRVAELGQLVDSVNVWGDVNSAGRYLVPEGTNIPELISYSQGYNTLRGREAELDWSQVHLEIKVSRLNQAEQSMEVVYFRYQYHDAEPVEMFDFILQNNDIVTLQLRRSPSLRDYVQVISSSLGAVATSLLLIERLRD
ncbi:hypothetical protein DYD21_01095 [Rhodohalobacter sp. SW132]|uniref:hypothetical protein n=1 Tax=Rhodohalobacter sp. SW132 TaxID=2293433 RepID=UPI000E258F20|nr:hypothetical protein [Rhodohalobacter sp. SW132]REL38576.1 hypothetical protein DYD21_01095 [Rhodohalobacter sp. SW132]